MSQDHDGDDCDEAEADVEGQVAARGLSMDGTLGGADTGRLLKVMLGWILMGMAGKRRVVAGKVWYFDAAAPCRCVALAVSRAAASAAASFVAGP